jgi:hypothetical protein
MNSVYKYVYLFFLLIVVVGVAAAHLSGCRSKGGGGLPDLSNKYLKEVVVYGDNSVVAVVELPDGAYGLLYLEDRITAIPVVASGNVELGIFEAGAYRLYLDVLMLAIPATVETEFLDFEVPVLPGGDDPLPDPKDPPEDPPVDPQPDSGRDKPTLTCNYNEDGAAALVISFNNFSTPVILRRIDDLAGDLVLDGDLVVADIPLLPGEYTFQLLDPDTQEVLATCTLIIPFPPGQEPENPPVDPPVVEGPELPPEPTDPRVRFIIRHNGHFIVVPWSALRAHLEHGDEIGFGTILRGCKK